MESKKYAGATRDASGQGWNVPDLGWFRSFPCPHNGERWIGSESWGLMVPCFCMFVEDPEGVLAEIDAISSALDSKKNGVDPYSGYDKWTPARTQIAELRASYIEERKGNEVVNISKLEDEKTEAPKRGKNVAPFMPGARVEALESGAWRSGTVDSCRKDKDGSWAVWVDFYTPGYGTCSYLLPASDVRLPIAPAAEPTEEEKEAELVASRTDPLREGVVALTVTPEDYPATDIYRCTRCGLEWAQGTLQGNACPVCDYCYRCGCTRKVDNGEDGYGYCPACEGSGIELY